MGWRYKHSPTPKVETPKVEEPPSKQSRSTPRREYHKVDSAEFYSQRPIPAPNSEYPPGHPLHPKG